MRALVRLFSLLTILSFLVVAFQNFGPTFGANELNAAAIAEDGRLSVRLAFVNGSAITKVKSSTSTYSSQDIQKVSIVLSKRGTQLKEFKWERRSPNDIVSDQHEFQIAKLHGVDIQGSIEIKDAVTNAKKVFVGQTRADVMESDSNVMVMLVEN